MEFIAYTFKGRKEIRSQAHDTREAAAHELFQAHAKLHRVETAVAVKTDGGTFVTFGKDIRSVSRLEAAKAMQQTPITATRDAEQAIGPATVKDARARCEEKFRHWPIVLVIHVNAFTRQIVGGYVMRHGVKTEARNFAEMMEMLADNPKTPVEFLSV